jgi:glutamate---cysteine ligase / carboxylate-amine ligase
MLVDAETLLLAPASPSIVAAAEAELGPGRIKTELFACVVESNTGICATPGEAAARLRELRQVAVRLAGERDLKVFAAGAHPISRPEEQEVVPEERYLAFVDYAGVSARRQGVNGLHVHVGMPDAETCFRALEGALQWLPVVLALSANSPYLSGEETGLASNRAEILAQLPRSGAPPAFRDFDGWAAFVDRLVELGVIPDYTMLWWDIRPHPRFGTLEVRMPDQPTDSARSAAIVALVHRLCVAAAGREAPPYDPAARALYQQNRWAALRSGLDAELVHPDGSRMAPARELAEELFELAGVTLDTTQTESEQQLATGRADGLEALTAALVERTLD